MRRLTQLLLAALLLLPGAPLFAQFDAATFVGTVKDDSGGVIPGATVTLTNLETGITATRVTDENGNLEADAQIRADGALIARVRAVPIPLLARGDLTPEAIRRRRTRSSSAATAAPA